MKTLKYLIIGFLLVSLSCKTESDKEEKKESTGYRKYISLNINESTKVKLFDGTQASIKLLKVVYKKDKIRKAVREANILLLVDGEEKWIGAGNQNLPVKFENVKIDCPITKAHLENGNFPKGMWRLNKEVKLRIWPINYDINQDDLIAFQSKQKWFGTGQTTHGLEPVEIDHDCTKPNDKDKIYYHWGMDLAGVKGYTPVLAAGDGVVISVGRIELGKPSENDSNYFKEEPFFNVPDSIARLPKPRFERIFVRMNNGCVYRYSHLDQILVKLGDTVKGGDVIGILGNNMSDFAHNHFEIWSIDEDDDNNYTLELAYPYVWESYIKNHKPKILAVVGTHKYIAVGDSVKLDASRSVSFKGEITDYEWTFHDSTIAKGVEVYKKFNKPGYYSEQIKVTDDKGNTAYDFANVIVVYDDKPDKIYGYPTAGYYPTLDLKAGDTITFKGRYFNIDEGEDHWDFGDGTTRITHSKGEPYAPNGYVELKHIYKKPGHYTVTFTRQTDEGIPSTSQLSVFIEE
jgi:PKD repeat protein